MISHSIETTVGEQIGEKVAVHHNGGKYSAVTSSRPYKGFFVLPFCATGKKPSVSEEPKSQVVRLPSDSVELLLKKLNTNFKDTGCPTFPLALLWLVFIVTLVFNFRGSVGDPGQQVLRGVALAFFILTVCLTKGL